MVYLNGSRKLRGNGRLRSAEWAGLAATALIPESLFWLLESSSEILLWCDSGHCHQEQKEEQETPFPLLLQCQCVPVELSAFVWLVKQFSETYPSVNSETERRRDDPENMSLPQSMGLWQGDLAQISQNKVFLLGMK